MSEMVDERKEAQEPEKVVAEEPVEAGADVSASEAQQKGRSRRAGESAPPGVGGAATPAEKLQRIREVLSELSTAMGVQAEVQVRDEEEIIGCKLDVKSGGEIFDMGPRGQVIEALGFLASRIVNREGDDRKRILVEVGAFPETGMDPAMEAMAGRLAEAAKRIEKTLTIVPIPARDRRLVHQVIGGIEGVRTRSEGEGLLRRLLVELEEESPATGAEEG